MKVSKMVVMAMSFSLVMGLIVPLTWAGEVKLRETNQEARIAQGVASGQLTARETARIEKGEARIERDRQAALADGKLTRREKVKLNHEENKESHKIYKAKHNTRKR